MAITRKNKKSMKQYRKPLKDKRRSLRKKRKSLKQINRRMKYNEKKHEHKSNKRKTHKRKTHKRKLSKKHQKGGNEPIINSATWVNQKPSFLPPGGGYDTDCIENGLGGGYYYDVQTCPWPRAKSTVDDPENLSSIQRKQSGGAYTSLGGLTGLFRQGVHSLKNVVSTYTTRDREESPNPMDQPINKEFNK